MKFSSPKHALRWAYETSNRPIVRTSALTDIPHSEIDAQRMTAHDRHAQSALILSMCERVLPALHMAYVRIQFGREDGGLDLLAHHIACNYGTGIHNRKSINLIIRAYCGEKIGLREIRKSMACGILKAVSYRNQAYDALDVLHLDTMGILRLEMESRGILRSVQIA